MPRPSAPDSTGSWFGRPVGLRLLAAEGAACRDALGRVSGTFSAVFAVGTTRSELLDPLDFAARHVFAVGDGNGQFLCPVRARPSQLPIASEALRLVVLQHVLETMRDPADFLAECDRIVAPGGALAVFGLNPTGRSVRWRRDPPPWVRRWWSATEVRQALAPASFQLERSVPVFSDDNWWERLGQGRETQRRGRLLGLVGSGYLLVFSKPANGARVIPLGREQRRRGMAGVTSTVGSLAVRRTGNGQAERDAKVG